ncbi:MAG TPA: DNA-3-methyladenine glycosylase I [Bryobacteraceae bacterium]|nr:DNA-3-methyladenine glycosylase I [Bryobacteraceae bacterium]
MSYCEMVRQGIGDQHRLYHDTEYGFPLATDAELFGRLLLEINQAGLSWTTILNKKDNFERAYAGYDIDRVARFNHRDRARLMADTGIVRNRLKIEAAIENARRLREIRSRHGSFANWLDHHHPRELAEWTKLFKQTFCFTGGEIVREFLLSTGYLAGAHDADCPIFAKVKKRRPAWLRG